MLRLSSHKTYIAATGILLFSLGLFGLAFRSAFTGIGDRYLLLSLVLGFWGLMLSVQKN